MATVGSWYIIEYLPKNNPYHLRKAQRLRGHATSAVITQPHCEQRPLTFSGQARHMVILFSIYIRIFMECPSVIEIDFCVDHEQMPLPKIVFD